MGSFLETESDGSIALKLTLAVYASMFPSVDTICLLHGLFNTPKTTLVNFKLNKGPLINTNCRNKTTNYAPQKHKAHIVPRISIHQKHNLLKPEYSRNHHQITSIDGHQREPLLSHYQVLFSSPGAPSSSRRYDSSCSPRAAVSLSQVKSS